MFKHFKNEQGISLIMVIILLVLVGGLTAALLTAGIFNIGFGSDEVDRAQAFYAADAGVQYVKNALSNLDFEDMDSDDPFSEIGTENWKDLSAADASFMIESIDNDNNRVATFISTGRVNSGLNNRTITQKIEFSFDIASFFESALIINDRDNKDMEEYIEHWRGGQGGDFNYSVISAVDMGEWWDFLSDDYVVYEEGGESGGAVVDYKSFTQIDLAKITGDDEIIEAGQNYFFTPTTVQMGDDVIQWDSYDFDEDDPIIEGTIVNHGGTIYVYVGDGEISDKDNDPDETSSDWELLTEHKMWEDANDYEYGEIVYYEENGEGYFYMAIQDIPADEDEPEYPLPTNEDYWQFINNDEVIDYDLKGNIVFENSIVIVNGNLLTGLGNINFINSLVLVRDKIEFGGNTNLINSLVLAFNDAGYDEYVTITGANSIDVELLQGPVNPGWHGVEDILHEAGLDGDAIGYSFRTWRQTQ